MPVYNAGKYLSRAIESILGQTLVDLEFLIFDDGSTDGSLQMAERFARSDSRIRVFPRQHCGYTPHLNEGLHRACAPFYARMDADDIAAPERLERQLRYLEEHTDCVAVGTQALLVDEDDCPVLRTQHPLEHSAIESLHLQGRIRVHDPSLVLRTQVMRQIGGYDPRFEPAEGFEFLLRLGEVGQLANMADFLYRYRVHDKQVTVQRYDRQQQAMKEALAEACRRRGLKMTHAGPYLDRRTERPWQTHVLWAECAYRSGFQSTALKHARLGVALRPWSRTAWKVLYRIATRGPDTLAQAPSPPESS
jgi:glycosyltransferase involved in cell wall biosynthesis